MLLLIVSREGIKEIKMKDLKKLDINPDYKVDIARFYKQRIQVKTEDFNYEKIRS